MLLFPSRVNIRSSSLNNSNWWLWWHRDLWADALPLASSSMGRLLFSAEPHIRKVVWPIAEIGSPGFRHCMCSIVALFKQTLEICLKGISQPTKSVGTTACYRVKALSCYIAAQTIKHFGATFLCASIIMPASINIWRWSVKMTPPPLLAYFFAHFFVRLPYKL